MINLDAISKIPLEELGSEVSSIFQESNIDSSRMPSIEALKTLKNGPINIASNGMFNILLHYIVDNYRWEFNETSQWLDHDTIKGYVILLNVMGASRYICFLTEEQTVIMHDVKNAYEQILHGGGEQEFRNFMISLDGVLENTALTEEEKTHPLVAPYVIPENSGSLNIAEETSRFSGASWFDEIQKKTVILAGLGGIGSYVCFLLARVHPFCMFIYDDDKVEAANMSGQLYGNVDINTYKVDAIADMVNNYANYNSIYAIRERFTKDCESSDIMICGFDNMASRKLFFDKWHSHIFDKTPEEKAKCLFIDGRLGFEYMQVFAFTGNDAEAITKYKNTALFSDEEADETICSMKQTTYMANLIGSIIVNIFTNFVANEVANAPIRELPYMTTYDGSSMQLKIE